MEKRILIIGLVFLLLFSSVVPISIGSDAKISYDVQSFNRGNTLYVGGTGPNNYTKINDAIDNATDGDTIIVFYGTYHENITLNKELTLLGIENPDGQIPLLDKYDKVVIVIKKDNCTIQNFEIRTGEDAIRLESDKNEILNCIVSDAVKDLNLQSSSHNVIINNEFRGGWIGIRCVNSSYNLFQNNNVHHHVNGELNLFQDCDNNHVYNNNFSYSSNAAGIQNKGDSSNNIFNYNIIKNNAGGGVEINTGVNLTFIGNQLFDNSFSFYFNPISLSQLLTLNLEDNTINSKPIYFYKNQSDVTIPNDGGQVILVNCTNFTISDLNITNGDYAMLLVGCSYIDISDNHLSAGGSYGLSIKSCNNNTISKNIISRGSRPIVLENSDDTIISENIIYGSGQDGIELRGTCFRNQIILNEISQKNFGVDVYPYSEDNIISQNEIRLSPEFGIISHADNTQIFENIIESCKVGISAAGTSCLIQDNTITQSSQEGLSIYGLQNIVQGNTVSDSVLGIELSGGNNKIINNNFINNDDSAYFENALFNIWSRNYWSDNIIGPHVIRGKFHFLIGEGPSQIEIDFPCINVDWHPAKEPYDI
jgi:parallel beta-helix repeat protein